MPKAYHDTRFTGAVRSAAVGRDKEQSQGTPAWLLERVYQALGRPIALDPCDDGIRRVCARRHVALPENGLEVPWIGTTFFNPPFETLGDWVKKASGTRATGGIIGLFPMRAHRKYWPWVWRAQRICELARPVQYEGQEHGAPFACVTAYWGPRPEDFDDAFFDLGRLIDPLTLVNREHIVTLMDMQAQPETDDVKKRFSKALENSQRELHLSAFRETFDPQTACLASLEVLPDDVLETLATVPFAELFPAITVPAPTTTRKTRKAKNGASKNGAAKSGKAKARKKAPPTTAYKGAPGMDKAILAEIKRNGGEGVAMGSLKETFPATAPTEIRKHLQKLLEDEMIYTEGQKRGTKYIAYG